MGRTLRAELPQHHLRAWRRVTDSNKRGPPPDTQAWGAGKPPTLLPAGSLRPEHPLPQHFCLVLGAETLFLTLQLHVPFSTKAPIWNPFSIETVCVCVCVFFFFSCFFPPFDISRSFKHHQIDLAVNGEMTQNKMKQNPQKRN